MATPVTKPKKTTGPKGDWVKAERIAEMFDVSVGAVYHGDAGMDAIRSARIGTGDRPPRRWYLPDAIALKARMLQQATARQQQMNAPIRYGRRRLQIAKAG